MKDNLTLPFSKLAFCSPAPRSLSLFSLRALFDLAAARWPIFFFLRPPTSFLCHPRAPAYSSTLPTANPSASIPAACPGSPAESLANHPATNGQALCTTIHHQSTPLRAILTHTVSMILRTNSEDFNMGRGAYDTTGTPKPKPTPPPKSRR
ncbi:hypothetical protein CB0940_01023 [Cercospora beticola]|uniref:Uncharacterized protein n=1 Tax=Cercospora beticola TaxID=122368 RepID=A0A2G5I8K7_CERBT|nr:hypothetical protein CB0940_01023 [Cercospora beticola]PIB00803.1 hypothetical protein CB0940_01023 [Cercospora beticola]WPA96447.1 hypothetical protein RHO25_001054 [Cercospora beticola]CAK1355228.1 unnamed protein product [Cercospora beticola]